MHRREFLTATAAAALALPATTSATAAAQEPGERPQQDDSVKVLNPRNRVPVGLIVDDSTCLVNLAHFGIPHFAEVYPDRYRQDWRRLPREIPDSFVRTFADWCRDRGVKGKYSIVPYPACVGWVDRDMPGWPRRQLLDSIALVRDEMTADWDIHPEMISHTFAIDTRTGRPYPHRTADYLENTGFSVGKSADQLADYMAYALRILKNAGFRCEGVTTPGGFGNRSRVALARGTMEACRDVFAAEIPHYFRHLYTDERSVAPRVEYAGGLNSDDPRCVVSIIGCTGDWFGGWDGLNAGSADQFITASLQSGRMVDVIQRGEPALMVCHWPGMYFNGQLTGFRIFQTVVDRLQQRFDNLIWMKLSSLARYWAARELTAIQRDGHRITLQAPFATEDYTLQLPADMPRPIVLTHNQTKTRLAEITSPKELRTGTCLRTAERTLVCIPLRRGRSVLEADSSDGA